MNNEDNKVENSPLREDTIQNENIENNNTIDTLNNNISTMETINNPKKSNYLLADSELLYNFIGKNYQKFAMHSFNFAALVFSFIYLLFRKMYFYSFIVMIIYFLMSIFIKNPYFLCAGILVVDLLLFLYTNKLYFRHCRTKIDNIRYKNSIYNNELVLLECKKKGGTSILSVIFGFIINILVICALVFSYFYFINKTPIDKIYNKVIGLYINNEWELKMNNSTDFLEEDIVLSFNKANDNYKGTKLELIAYLGKQEVAGTNYMLLCKDKDSYKMVVMYVDLADNSSFTYVNDFDIDKYINKDNNSNVEDIDGGWKVEIPGRAVVLENKHQELFDKAQNELIGVSYYPVVVFENNDYYVILCFGRISNQEGTTGVYVMSFEKNSVKYKISSVDLKEYNK